MNIAIDSQKGAHDRRGLVHFNPDYQRNDREEISNTIPLGCKADLKLPLELGSGLKETITALLLSKR